GGDGRGFEMGGAGRRVRADRPGAQGRFRLTDAPARSTGPQASLKPGKSRVRYVSEGPNFRSTHRPPERRKTVTSCRSASKIQYSRTPKRRYSSRFSTYSRRLDPRETISTTISGIQAAQSTSSSSSGGSL